MSNEIKILGTIVKLGESAIVKMDIARLHTRSKVEVPIIISRGKKPGPSLLLMAGIHGDEVNGIEIVRQIVAKKYNKPERGTIICIPLLNVFGFLNHSREFPDGRDLNRVFPGAQKGSLASRFAYQLMSEVIPHVDYCIDYHTGGGQRFNYSHIRVDDNDDESLRLAKIFGAKFIMLAKNREKSFRESMVKKGNKVLLYEGGKSLFLDKNVTRVGVEGALKIIHELELRDFSKEISTFENKIKESIIIRSSKWIRARHSGMYRSYVSAGQLVEKGTLMGSISDPFGSFYREIKNPQKGYIINVNHSPVVNQGNALFNIGFEE